MIVKHIIQKVVATTAAARIGVYILFDRDTIKDLDETKSYDLNNKMSLVLILAFVGHVPTTDTVPQHILKYNN